MKTHRTSDRYTYVLHRLLDAGCTWQEADTIAREMSRA